jgi:hypothetical protein
MSSEGCHIAQGRVSSQLRVAASYDPAAFRAFWKINGMLCPPGSIPTRGS